MTSLDEAKRLAKETVDEALDALKNFGTEADFLRGLVKFLLTREK